MRTRRRKDEGRAPVRRKAPAGAEGASALGEGRPAGDEVLGPDERPDAPSRMDRQERTTDVPRPGPASPEVRRKRASRRAARGVEKKSARPGP